MSKKWRLTEPFNKQHGKRTRTLFKSERRQFCQIYWLLRRQLSLKKSLLVICKTLKPFVNTFTAHDKYSVLNRQSLQDPIHMQLSQKQQTFSNFSLHFWNLDQILQILKKKMTLVANVFSKLRTSKNPVR